MSDHEVAYVAPGSSPTDDEVKTIGELVRAILALPGFAGQPPNIVLNAMCSAWWTAACMVGRQVEVAEGMVQMGGSYLAGLALAQRAKAGNAGDDKPVVH